MSPALCALLCTQTKPGVLVNSQNLVRVLADSGIEFSKAESSLISGAKDFRIAKHTDRVGAILYGFSKSKTVHFRKDSTHNSASRKTLSQDQLKPKLTKFASDIAASFGLPPVNGLTYQPHVTSVTPGKDLSQTWFRRVNGFVGNFDGDYIRVSVNVKTGDVSGFTVQYGRIYEKPNIRISRLQAERIARSKLKFVDGEGSTHGRVEYHLFNTPELKQAFDKSGEIRLRLGYYFSCRTSSGVVDSQRGSVHLISCLGDCN